MKRIRWTGLLFVVVAALVAVRTVAIPSARGGITNPILRWCDPGCSVR